MSIEIAGRSVHVEANGIRHHLLSYGESGQPSVILLPGITSPAVTADFLARRIAAMGFAVHVPDIRGRGQTDAPPSGNYRLEDYAADVAGLVAALNLHDPLVIGHSMGARIAAAYATEHAAERRSLLVLVDPPLCGPGRGAYPTSLDSFMRQLGEAKRGTTPEAVRAFYPKWPVREILIRVEALQGCDETAIRESHEGFEAEDFFPYWRKVVAPAVLIYGGDSPVVTADGAADLARANPAVPLVRVPDAGHMIPWDNEPGFFDALTPWLEKARAAQSA